MTNIIKLVTFTLALGACAERANFAFECDDCVVEGPQGVAGESIQGEAGFDGHDALIEVLPLAVSCAAGGYSLLTATDSNSNGLIDSTDKNYSLVDVCNGVAGIDGAVGPSGILEVIDPCGDAQNAHDEVLLRLADGRLLASFSANANGAYTRFAYLVPGVNYGTTDQTGCFFSVDANNQLFNEHY